MKTEKVCGLRGMAQFSPFRDAGRTFSPTGFIQLRRRKKWCSKAEKCKYCTVRNAKFHNLYHFVNSHDIFGMT